MRPDFVGMRNVAPLPTGRGLRVHKTPTDPDTATTSSSLPFSLTKDSHERMRASVGTDGNHVEARLASSWRGHSGPAVRVGDARGRFIVCSN